MTKKRIKELSDFFYSSNNSDDVPVRISLTCGMGGFDLSKEALIYFLEILNSSKNLRNDLIIFRNTYGG